MEIFLPIFLAIFWLPRRGKTGAERRREELTREIDRLKDQILLVTTNVVPGERTAKTLGDVEALSRTEAASDWDFRLAEKEALLDLARQGIAMGANAIVGLRKTHAHYDQPGSKWRVSRVAYQGTAIVVNREAPRAAPRSPGTRTRLTR